MRKKIKFVFDVCNVFIFNEALSCAIMIQKIVMCMIFKQIIDRLLLAMFVMRMIFNQTIVLRNFGA